MTMTAPGKVTVEPLTAEAFAPFGDVLDTPARGRTDYARSLVSQRPGAWPIVGLMVRDAEPTGPFVARQMERHEFSSQSFIPTCSGRWLIVVAPHGANGQPDTSRVRAFLPAEGQGVTYAANVWHHGMTVFDRAQSFAVVMWMDGTEKDAELVDLDRPVAVEF